MNFFQKAGDEKCGSFGSRFWIDDDDDLVSQKDEEGETTRRNKWQLIKI